MAGPVSVALLSQLEAYRGGTCHFYRLCKARCSSLTGLTSCHSSDPTLAFWVVVMADVWGWIPFLTLVLIGGLASIPQETLEAGRMDGASGARILRDITLPQLKPVLAVVIILKAIFSLKTFDLVYMLTNGGPGSATQTLSHYVYFNGLKYSNIGYSAAVA